MRMNIAIDRSGQNPELINLESPAPGPSDEMVSFARQIGKGVLRSGATGYTVSRSEVMLMQSS